MGHSSERLTRRHLLRLGGGALGGMVGLGLLAACGGVATTTVPSASPAATTAVTVPASAAPTAAVASSQAPTSAASASAVPSAAAATPPSAGAASPSAGVAESPVATAARAVATFNGIAAGRTPEGFFTLGDPAATVTLVDYSDFL